MISFRSCDLLEKNVNMTMRPNSINLGRYTIFSKKIAMYQPLIIKCRLMIQISLRVAIATPYALNSCINI